MSLSYLDSKEVDYAADWFDEFLCKFFIFFHKIGLH